MKGEKEESCNLWLGAGDSIYFSGIFQVILPDNTTHFFGDFIF
jgi:hypothetical protein